MPNNKLNPKLNTNLFIVSDLRPKVIEKLNVRPVTASEAIRIAIDKVRSLKDLDYIGAVGNKKDGKDGSDVSQVSEFKKDAKEGKDVKEGSDDKEACDALFEFGMWDKLPPELVFKNPGTRVINGAIHNVASFIKPIM